MEENKNNIESYNSAKSKGIESFSVWSGVRAAVPAHLKSLDVIESELECPWNFTVGRKNLILLYVKINTFMNCLFRVRQEGFDKLKEDFGLAYLAESEDCII